MRSLGLLMALFVVILIACRKENCSEDLFVGKWRWRFSVGGFSGKDTIAPAKNSVVIVQFKQDSTFTIEQNNETISNGTFSVTTNGSQKIFTANYIGIIEFFFQAREKTIILQENELTLTDHNITEPYTHYYSKEY